MQPVALDLVPLSPYLKPAPLPDLPQVCAHVAAPSYLADNLDAHASQYASRSHVLATALRALGVIQFSVLLFLQVVKE